MIISNSLFHQLPFAFPALSRAKHRLASLLLLFVELLELQYVESRHKQSLSIEVRVMMGVS